MHIISGYSQRKRQYEDDEDLGQMFSKRSRDLDDTESDPVKTKVIPKGPVIHELKLKEPPKNSRETGKKKTGKIFVLKIRGI